MGLLFKFSITERMRILNHASKVMAGGHWGGGNIVIPEQEILFKKIEAESGEIELSLFQCSILIDWVEEGTYYGSVKVMDDDLLIQKIIKAFNLYSYDLHSAYLFETEKIECAVARLKKIFCQDIDCSDIPAKCLIKENYNEQSLMSELKNANDKIDKLQQSLDLLMENYNKKSDITLFEKFHKFFQRKEDEIILNDKSMNRSSFTHNNASNSDVAALIANAKKQIKLFK